MYAKIFLTIIHSKQFYKSKICIKYKTAKNAKYDSINDNPQKQI